MLIPMKLSPNSICLFIFRVQFNFFLFSHQNLVKNCHDSCTSPPSWTSKLKAEANKLSQIWTTPANNYRLLLISILNHAYTIYSILIVRIILYHFLKIFNLFVHEVRKKNSFSWFMETSHSSVGNVQHAFYQIILNIAGNC